MHRAPVLHSPQFPSLEFMHRARWRALKQTVESVVLRGSRLTLTDMGRHRGGPGKTKHHIKAVDRLLGNARLAEDRLGAYRAMAARLLFPGDEPAILVDWSDASEKREVVFIRATIRWQCRGLVLYEQAFPIQRYNTAAAHRTFLDGLAAVLPAGVRPIIVTDAGFHNPWFRDVQARGWNWVGRIRGTTQWRFNAQSPWETLGALRARAGRKAQALGAVEMARQHSLKGSLYLAPCPWKARKHAQKEARKRTQSGGRSRNDHRARKAYNEPWVLFSSLDRPPQALMAFYHKRMSIEASFRDLKSARFGLGFEFGRARNAERVNALLLIAALALWMLASIGWQARQSGIDRTLQANTVKKTDVLSVYTLARILLAQNRIPQRLQTCSFTQEFVGIG